MNVRNPLPAIDSLNIHRCFLHMQVPQQVDVASTEAFLQASVRDVLGDLSLPSVGLGADLMRLFPKGEINLGSLELSLPPLAQEELTTEFAQLLKRQVYQAIVNSVKAKVAEVRAVAAVNSNPEERQPKKETKSKEAKSTKINGAGQSIAESDNQTAQHPSNALSIKDKLNDQQSQNAIHAVSRLLRLLSFWQRSDANYSQQVKYVGEISALLSDNNVFSPHVVTVLEKWLARQQQRLFPAPLAGQIDVLHQALKNQIKRSLNSVFSGASLANEEKVQSSIALPDISWLKSLSIHPQLPSAIHNEIQALLSEVLRFEKDAINLPEKMLYREAFLRSAQKLDKLLKAFLSHQDADNQDYTSSKTAGDKLHAMMIYHIYQNVMEEKNKIPGFSEWLEDSDKRVSSLSYSSPYQLEQQTWQQLLIVLPKIITMIKSAKGALIGFCQTDQAVSDTSQSAETKRELIADYFKRQLPLSVQPLFEGVRQGTLQYQTLTNETDSEALHPPYRQHLYGMLAHLRALLAQASIAQRLVLQKKISLAMTEHDKPKKSNIYPQSLSEKNDLKAILHRCQQQLEREDFIDTPLLHNAWRQQLSELFFDELLCGEVLNTASVARIKNNVADSENASLGTLRTLALAISTAESPEQLLKHIKNTDFPESAKRLFIDKLTQSIEQEKQTKALKDIQSVLSKQLQQLEALKPVTWDDLVAIDAGLILLWPFLKKWFQDLELLQKDGTEFLGQSAQLKARALLQYISGIIFINNEKDTSKKGRDDSVGHHLVANLLLGLAPTLRMDHEDVEAVLDEVDKQSANKLLSAVITHWQALKNMPVHSFQQMFIQRRAQCSATDTGWKIEVTKSGTDILLTKLPWTIGVISLPWLHTENGTQKLIHVKWDSGLF